MSIVIFREHLYLSLVQQLLQLLRDAKRGREKSREKIAENGPLGVYVSGALFFALVFIIDLIKMLICCHV